MRREPQLFGLNGVGAVKGDRADDPSGVEAGCMRSGYRWVILTLACLLCFMGNYMQYQVSAYATQLMPMLGIGSVGFSALFLAPMLAAVILSLPFGSLGDKFGTKSIVLAGFCVSLCGGMLRVVSVSSYPCQLISMFLIGIGMAALTSNNAKVLGLWFAERTDVAMGAYYAAACLGIASAQASSLIFPDMERGYIIAEGLLVVITVGWALLGRNVSHGSLIPESVESDSSLRVAMRSRNVWLCALSAAFSLAATTAFSGVLPQALELVRGADASSAGRMAAVATVAGIFGCLLAPLLYERCSHARPYLVMTGCMGAAAIAASWFASGASSAAWVLLAFNGFVTSMMGPIEQALPVSFSEIGTRHAGSAGGIMAEVSLLGSCALPLGIAALAGGDYNVQMILIAVLYGLSVVPVLGLPEVKANG